MKKLLFLFRYLLYIIRSTTAHGVHSPFVYDLVTQVIYVKSNYYAFSKINKLRQQLIVNDREINTQDFGAGSYHSNAHSKKIGEIVKSAAKPRKYGELLFRLVNRFSPQTILELGTSLGISGAYLASACKNANLITIEASYEISNLAIKNFKEMNLSNATVIAGTFEDKLDTAIDKLNQLDFVFFDGNHKKVPTLAYFKKCLKYSHNESVFIFDDIHWSREMEEAWLEIKNHPSVTVTIDLFFIGIVFFRNQQAKEHFTIRY